MSPKWPFLCWTGRKTLTQSVNGFLGEGCWCVCARFERIGFYSFCDLCIITLPLIGCKALQWVCMCLYAHISKTTCPNFTKFLLHVAHGFCLILVWWCCDTFRISGFVDVAMFIHNDQTWAMWMWHMLKVTHQLTAWVWYCHIRCMNEVTLCWTPLVLWWMTIFRLVCHFDMKTSQPAQLSLVPFQGW